MREVMDKKILLILQSKGIDLQKIPISSIFLLRKNLSLSCRCKNLGIFIYICAIAMGLSASGREELRKLQRKLCGSSIININI